MSDGGGQVLTIGQCRCARRHWRHRMVRRSHRTMCRVKRMPSHTISRATMKLEYTALARNAPLWNADSPRRLRRRQASTAVTKGAARTKENRPRVAIPDHSQKSAVSAIKTQPPRVANRMKYAINGGSGMPARLIRKQSQQKTVNPAKGTSR